MNEFLYIPRSPTTWSVHCILIISLLTFHWNMVGNQHNLRHRSYKFMLGSLKILGTFLCCEEVFITLILLMKRWFRRTQLSPKILGTQWMIKNKYSLGALHFYLLYESESLADKILECRSPSFPAPN